MTFAVDQWLSHSDGPAQFQAFTGQGGGDCGIGPINGQVAIFVYGSINEPNVNICGSVQPVGDAIDAYAGKTLPDFPVPFDNTPGPTGGGGSYADLVLPAALGSLVVAGIAFGITRARRTRESQLD